MDIPYPAILAVYNQVSSWIVVMIKSMSMIMIMTTIKMIQKKVCEVCHQICHLIWEWGLNLFCNDGVCAEDGGDAGGAGLVDPLGCDALGSRFLSLCF